MATFTTSLGATQTTRALPEEAKPNGRSTADSQLNTGNAPDNALHASVAVLSGKSTGRKLSEEPSTSPAGPGVEEQPDTDKSKLEGVTASQQQDELPPPSPSPEGNDRNNNTASPIYTQKPHAFFTALKNKQHSKAAAPESHQQRPKNQKWAQAYETFLLSNASRLANMESTIRSLSYLATGQMQNVEIVTETLYSMLQILSLYHDRVINGAIQKLASNNNTSDNTEKKGATISGDPQSMRPSMHNRYTQWTMARSKAYKILAIVLTLLQQTELLWEMIGRQGLSISILGTRISLGKSTKESGSASDTARDKGRWRAILYIEAIKALLRLGLLATTQGRTVLSSPIPRRDVDPSRIVQDRRGNFKILDEDEVAQYQQREQERELRRLTQDAEEHEAELEREEREDKKKWWKMPRLGMGLPDNPPQDDLESFLSRKVLTAEDVRGPEGLVHKLSGLGLAAETLYILRPLVYAGLVYYYSQRARTNPKAGRRSIYGSWTPWLAGIAMEYAARSLAFKAQREALPGGLRSLTKLEAEEYKERGTNFGWWMLRGAMYENWTRLVLSMWKWEY